MTCIIDERVRLFVRLLSERLGDQLIRVILFGSHARGDAHEDSDYDCLVIVREITPDVRDATDDAAGEVILQAGAVISAFLTTEVAANKPFSPLLMSVRAEGVVL